MLSDWIHVTLLALLGTGHCVGMCGAFALAAGSGGTVGSGARLRWWLRQVSYQLGKGTAYVFVGVALLVATKWVESRAPVEHLQNGIGWVVGVIMVLMGAAQAANRRLPQSWMRWWQGSAACGLLTGLGQSQSPFKGLLIGWVNGFLPCGLSLAAILYLVGTQSVGTLVGGAFVFSLATMPGLAATAWLLPRMGTNRRDLMLRLAGVVLIALGVLTILRGNPSVHHWFHELLVP
jgi:sulfite exporter TauE/SafE